MTIITKSGIWDYHYIFFSNNKKERVQYSAMPNMETNQDTC